MFARIGKLINGDVEGFKSGFDEKIIKKASKIITNIRSFFRQLGAAINRLFTGKGAEEILSSDAINRIDGIKQGISKVFNAISLLFVGNKDNKTNLSKIETFIISFRDSVIFAFGKVKDGIITVWAAI